MTSQLVPMPQGHSLEAIFTPPPVSGPAHPPRLAVLLHPWSWLGGRMHDHVIETLSSSFIQRGFHTIVFNSRGVGASTGRASFTGFPEVEDLKEIIKWGVSKIQNVQSVTILGYSHGSLIASLHPLLDPPISTSHILLSYPLSTRSLLTLFKSSTYSSGLRSLLQEPSSNVLIIYGDEDNFTSISQYKKWTGELLKITRGRLKTYEVEDADHFWRGENGERMWERIESWLDES
ncbi:alpha/beta-hydrolase [Sistotremastrum suecicum HHB10207 ss-3]|uniref:Alpha/beta-hydrolase n=1 Tax=Sistotremastrum suecicum HHB10207 ss-3 TaxID=1314776 RepID=A0A166GYU8_9AGAM|nr:alpha/beta-hydrolase [Sistotremastrum suecicum HHB10207 ss-3]